MIFDLPLWLTLSLSIMSAGLVTYFLTPPVKKFAEIIGAVDIPGDARRIHTLPIPRMGGLAIFISFIITILIFADINTQIAGMLAGATLIAVMGAIDDIISLKPLPKLVVQIFAALIAYRSGVVFNVLSNPNFLSQQTFFRLDTFALPLTIIWIVGCTNAVNLIDGLDGLAAGVSAISSVSMLIVSISFAEPNIALLLAALSGACIGFLPYNSNPAVIFMGDLGAQLLGYLLGVISIMGMLKLHTIIAFIVPILAMAVPLADTAFAFFRRLLKGQSPFKADAGHIHHRLMALGLDQKQVVAALYGVSAILGLLAVVLSSTHVAARILSIVLAFAAAVSVWFYIVKHNRRNDGEDKK